MDTLVSVHFDEVTITVTREEGIQEIVKWDDLVAVRIKTTDSGPFTEDVFFVLIGKGARSGCVVPQSAAGEKELFAALQERLPGFDNDQVIQAMMSTCNNSFLVWERPGIG